MRAISSISAEICSSDNESVVAAVVVAVVVFVAASVCEAGCRNLAN
jgi:hypothetical protein